MVLSTGSDQISDESWAWLLRTSGLTLSEGMSAFVGHLKRTPATALSYAASIAVRMIVNQSVFSGEPGGPACSRSA